MSIICPTVTTARRFSVRDRAVVTGGPEMGHNLSGVVGRRDGSRSAGQFPAGDLLAVAALERGGGEGDARARADDGHVGDLAAAAGQRVVVGRRVVRCEREGADALVEI